MLTDFKTETLTKKRLAMYWSDDETLWPEVPGTKLCIFPTGSGSIFADSVVAAT